MGHITTSYFALARHMECTKISTARYNPPRMTGRVEIQTAFAPSKALLGKYKSGGLSWGKYTRSYLKEQERHFRERPDDFKRILERAELEEITLLCYEKYVGVGTQCHRLLLYDYLQECANELKYDVNFIPETFRKKQ